MIQPKILRNLKLSAAPGVGRPCYVAAGSGLVAIEDFLYVVANDELHLGCFRRSSTAADSLVRLFPGELPNEHAERKAAKPDLEALVHLPAFSNYPEGGFAGGAFGIDRAALSSGLAPARRTWRDRRRARKN